MISCRYVGSSFTEIGDREFDTVGQRAVFSEKVFRTVILGGGTFITEEQFNRIGFTHDELSRHGASGDRFNPPASFCQKLEVAQSIFRDMLYQLSQNGQKTLAELSDAVGLEIANVD